MSKTRVALLGTGFIAGIHMESYHRFVPDAQVVAVFSRDAGKAAAFAVRHGIPRHFDAIDTLLKETDCDVVDICLPNYLHHEACMLAAGANKHVIIEKPLCLTLEEADEMIAACRANGKLLMYAEELCFAPKYERVRAIVESGAVGDIFMLKQAEQHSGPHSRWFYESAKAGGGVLMDMGCHAFAWFRWMLGKAPVVSVYADLSQVMHDTDAEDHSLVLVEFATGHGKVIALAQNSWCKQGGMDDHMEVIGTRGIASGDLFRGNSSVIYSLDGYDYASEKAGGTQGWTFPIFEEAFNQGYPEELRHFIACVREGKQPKVTGEDGKAVLEILYAAYASAKAGSKISLPFHAKVTKPWDLWKA
ncbi:MAG: Gfo/Idh/MocA family protein [Christensenellales bacterium]